MKREAKAIAANTKLFKEALLVLDHLGVPAKVFYDLQEKACAEFASEHDDPE